jgi:hypothetical protein
MSAARNAATALRVRALGHYTMKAGGILFHCLVALLLATAGVEILNAVLRSLVAGPG